MTNKKTIQIIKNYFYYPQSEYINNKNPPEITLNSKQTKKLLKICNIAKIKVFNSNIKISKKNNYCIYSEPHYYNNTTLNIKIKEV